jgi:hypothetical protein
MVHTDSSVVAAVDWAKGVIRGVVAACYGGWRNSDVL